MNAIQQIIHQSTIVVFFQKAMGIPLCASLKKGWFGVAYRAFREESRHRQKVQMRPYKNVAIDYPGII